MQARFISFLAATAVVAAATLAFADEQNTPPGVQTQPAEAGFDYFLKIDGVKGESRDPPPPPPPPPQNAPGAQPGIQAQTAQTTDGLLILRYLNAEGEEQAAPSAQANVSPQPAEPLTDGLMVLRAMFGDEPQTPERPVDASNTDESTALLVPAIQRVREAAAGAPQGDGVVVLDTTLPSNNAIGSANGGVWRSTNGGAAESATAREVTTGGQGVVPELPICGHCGAEVRRTGVTESAPRDPEQPVCGHCGADVAAAPAAATTEERPRRRVFSLSIGGITVGSDGSVNVAVGDVTGDGHDDEGGQRPVRARPSQRR